MKKSRFTEDIPSESSRDAALFAFRLVWRTKTLTVAFDCGKLKHCLFYAHVYSMSRAMNSRPCRLTCGTGRNFPMAKWPSQGSNQYPFDFIQTHLVVSAVVESCGPRRLMIRHLLRDFKLAAIAHIFRDARRTKSVTTDFCLDVGIFSAPRNHAIDIYLRQSILGQLTGFAEHATKQETFPIGRELCAIDVGR